MSIRCFQSVGCKRILARKSNLRESNVIIFFGRHAGYSYSGPTAAFAYGAIKPEKVYVTIPYLLINIFCAKREEQ